MTRKRKRQGEGANTSWFQLATEKRPTLVVPVSDKMFQAEIPPISISTGNRSKWLGTKLWPPQKESSYDPTHEDGRKKM